MERVQKKENVRADRNAKKFLIKLFHFTNKKSEALKGAVTCPRPHNFLVVRPEQNTEWKAPLWDGKKTCGRGHEWKLHHKDSWEQENKERHDQETIKRRQKKKRSEK